MNELAEIAVETAPFTGLDRILRDRFIDRLRGLRSGRLVLEDACGRTELGEPADLDVTVRILRPSFYRTIASQGSVGAAEAYMEGEWQCSDLVALVRLLVRNRAVLDGMESGPARVAGWLLRAWHALQRNTHAGSRRNIAAHYDLGNEFFRLFLSSDLMYSSAVWAPSEADTLETASIRKLQLICAKLDLRPTDHVIEIGSGWGGFALHAAANHGCRVTTVTVSREQYELTKQRITQAGLTERVSVLLRDYRDIDGQYDKLVSIEMIEAVGAQYLETYLRKIGSLLKPEGLALVQAITIEDHRYEQALREVDFIKRYIFPGSFIPSVNAIVAAKTRASDLALIHLEDFGGSYARTLEAWRERFLQRLPEVRNLGFDERFIRMWEFYFTYCEGGFREGSIGLAQLLMRGSAL